MADKTAPSKSLLQRLLGGVMSKSTEEGWPELATAWAGREVNMPTEAAGTQRVIEMGPVSRMLFKNAYGVTGPFNTIALNRQAIEQDKQNLDDILTHELTHVGQGQREGLLKKHLKSIATTASSDYLNRPLEQEAFEAEQSRKAIKGDIFLPRPKKKKVTEPTTAMLNKLVK